MTDELAVDSFVIGGKEYPSDLRGDLQINQAAINNDFCTHPERFSYYATLYELAVFHEMSIKADLDRSYAQLDFMIRQEAALSAVKLTEKKVENSVITRPEYINLQNKYFEAKKQAGLLKAARDAMIHRRDMLIQLGANYRAEGTSNIGIRTEDYLHNNSGT